MQDVKLIQLVHCNNPTQKNLRRKRQSVMSSTTMRNIDIEDKNTERKQSLMISMMTDIKE